MVAPWIKKQHPAEFDDAPAPKPEVEAEVVADDSVKSKNTEKPKAPRRRRKKATKAT